MADRPRISQLFNRTPDEAVNFLRQKGYAIGFDYRDVWQQEHQTAFTVAKAMRLDILEDIRKGVDKAIVEGTTYETFLKELKPLLVKKGWWGKAHMVDPLTGELKLVQLGSPRRLKVIYETNLRQAHMEGQWERIQAAKSFRPYVQYLHTPSQHERPEHAAWDRLILPVDDPWWQTHYPVKAWGCKCGVRSLSDDDLKREGVSVGTAPPDAMYEYINPRTGEHSIIPAGVDPAFAYPPGGRAASLNKMLAQKAANLTAPPVVPALTPATLPPTSTPIAAPQTLDDYIAEGKKITDALPQEPAALHAALIKKLQADVGTGLAAKVTGTGAGAKQVRQASALYPRTWVDAANKFGPLHARLDGINGRGWHITLAPSLPAGYKTRIPGFGVVTINPNAGYIAVLKGDLPNTIHEYAHRLQAAMPKLQALFKTLHDRRTSGHALESLKTLEPTLKYAANEMTRRDHYINPYWGKEYNGEPLEILTMAMQIVLSGTRWKGGIPFQKLYTDDREMFDFVVGILFYWRP